MTFSPAFRSTFPFLPFTVKVPAAASSASIVPPTWCAFALATFFAAGAFSAAGAAAGAFSTAGAAAGAAFSAATAKPATENANATAITTVKIFFISFPLQGSI